MSSEKRREISEEQKRECMEVVREFLLEVNDRALQKMMLTNRLEGSHFAAMMEVFFQWYDEELDLR